MTSISNISSVQDIAALMQQIGVAPGHFSLSSRYNNIPVTTLTTNTGENIVYLKRRFIPPAESFATLQFYKVKEGDRLDNITNQFIGDPEKFWQICDANNVLEPSELTEEPGHTIRITLPQGIPGNINA